MLVVAISVAHAAPPLSDEALSQLGFAQELAIQAQFLGGTYKEVAGGVADALAAERRFWLATAPESLHSSDPKTELERARRAAVRDEFLKSQLLDAEARYFQGLVQLRPDQTDSIETWRMQSQRDRVLRDRMVLGRGIHGLDVDLVHACAEVGIEIDEHHELDAALRTYCQDLAERLSALERACVTFERERIEAEISLQAAVASAPLDACSSQIAAKSAADSRIPIACVAVRRVTGEACSRLLAAMPFEHKERFVLVAAPRLLPPGSNGHSSAQWISKVMDLDDLTPEQRAVAQPILSGLASLLASTFKELDAARYLSIAHSIERSESTVRAALEYSMGLRQFPENVDEAATLPTHFDATLQEAKATWDATAARANTRIGEARSRISKLLDDRQRQIVFENRE